MNLEPKHWAVIAAMMTGVGTQLLTASHGWTDIATPGFAAGLLIQIAAAITAIFVGAPGAGAAQATTKATDPSDLGKVDPKRFVGPAILLVCVLGAAVSLPACATTRPPARTFSAAGVKAFDADEALKAITALSQTAININAERGRLHLSDRDTALIRDFALSAGAGLLAYGQGKGTLAIVVSAFHELTVKLSAEAVLNDQLRVVLALVADQIGRIGVPS